jgi:hypothetical protein
MCVLSTLRTSITQLFGSRVTWHPQGITSVRRFTIEPCAALPKRSLKHIPTSTIRNSNLEEACPFIIPEPELETESDFTDEYYGPSVSMNKFLQAGIESIREAVESDALATKNGTNYDQVIQKYMEGLEYIQYARKHEKNSEGRNILNTKMAQYLDRVEELKNIPFEEDSIELIMLTDQCYPDNFLCHTHRRDYIEWRSEQQINETIYNDYVTELPLSFIEEDDDTLYG